MAAGKFAEAVAEGRVFSVSTVVAGLSIPISTTTAPNILLWNPADSGVCLNLLRYTAAYVSGTTVAGAIGFQSMSVGSRGITGQTNAAIGNITQSTITNALIGSGAVSKARASSAQTNAIVAVVKFHPIGLSLHAAIATSAISAYLLKYDFDGLYQLLPGTACFPCASAASGALYAQTLYWEEAPMCD